MFDAFTDSFRPSKQNYYSQAKSPSISMGEI